MSRELQNKGVSSSRIEIAGYADQRPIDTTGSKEGMARNRRVEVLILPTTGHSTPVAQPEAASHLLTKATPPAKPTGGNKDDAPPPPATQKKQVPFESK